MLTASRQFKKIFYYVSEKLWPYGDNKTCAFLCNHSTHGNKMNIIMYINFCENNGVMNMPSILLQIYEQVTLLYTAASQPMMRQFYKNNSPREHKSKSIWAVMGNLLLSQQVLQLHMRKATIFICFYFLFNPNIMKDEKMRVQQWVRLLSPLIS